MTPAQWTSFWEVLIVVAVGGFAVLAVYVAIAGIADIRSMLRHMKPTESDGASRET